MNMSNEQKDKGVFAFLEGFFYSLFAQSEIREDERKGFRIFLAILIGAFILLMIFLLA